MAFSLVPTHVCESIYDIDYAALSQRGVRLVLTDLDNTLVSYAQREPTPELRGWVEELKGLGLSVFVLSNSRKSRRCPDFCQKLGVPFLRHAGKPGVRGYERAMEQMGVRAGQTVMLGDQVFTDTLGANRAGVEVWLVRPVALDNPFRAARFAVERPFRALAAGREARKRGEQG